MNASFAATAQETPLADDPIEARVIELVEPVDALRKRSARWSRLIFAGEVSEDMRSAAIEVGQVGSLLNVVDVDVANELQRIATEESRLGIPLLLARDVIHGFRTVLPIPLGAGRHLEPGTGRARDAKSRRWKR